VFEHSYARDAIKLAVNVAIVLESNFHPVGKARLFYPLSGERVLLLGKRNADASRAKLFRSTYY
jgi:hypothetical protein